jgi:hypothetical protein
LSFLKVRYGTPLLACFADWIELKEFPQRVSPNVSAAAALTRNKDEHFWVTAPDLPRGMVKLWSVKK